MSRPEADGDPTRSAAPRVEAFGQSSSPSAIDRLGIWLSKRSIRRAVGSFVGKRVGDFGSGYDARTVRPFLSDIESLLLVDVALSPELVALSMVTAVEGPLPAAMRSIAGESLDVVLCISVLEHLSEPAEMVRELYRVLSPGGICVVNVPTWRGKRLLEFSAFRLRLSPACEMDDHKMYYDPRDLWPLLVQAGFAPHAISCHRHKFGLNTLAVCKKTDHHG